MLFRKRTTTNDLTVASLKKSVEKSVVKKGEVKLRAFIGRTRRFYQDYRMPALATCGFLLLLLAFAVVRQFEKTSLLSLRNTVSEGGNGYSLLLRDDEADEFTRNDTTEDRGEGTTNETTGGSSSTQSTSNSFTLDTGGTSNDGSGSNSGGASGGGSGSGSSGGGNGGGTTTPPQPFASSINSFDLTSVSLQCTNPSKPNKGSCSKLYSFSAGVKTINGPGTVNYSWQSSTDAGNGAGTFSVADASAITTLSKELTISCNRTISFTMQLAVTSPTAETSNMLSINHNCNEI